MRALRFIVVAISERGNGSFPKENIIQRDGANCMVYPYDTKTDDHVLVRKWKKSADDAINRSSGKPPVP